jgi:hypothetical protein
MGDWCAKHSHDPVAQEFVHRSLVAKDDVRHLPEIFVEQADHLLSVKLQHQFGGTTQVSDQDRYFLAMTFHRKLHPAVEQAVYNLGAMNCSNMPPRAIKFLLLVEQRINNVRS